MRIKYFILVLSLFFFIFCSNQKKILSTCNCDGMEVVYLLEEKEEKLLVVCGFSGEEQTISEKTVSSLLVRDCKNDKTIIDFSNDEIQKFILSKNGQKIILFSTKLILVGDDWKYELVKETEQTIFIEKGEVKLSDNKNVFIAPTFSIEQHKDLSKLNDSLLERLKGQNKPVYPNDEKSIYMLYMGFLNNDDESKYFLQNLRNLFKVDGAISETLSEVGF